MSFIPYARQSIDADDIRIVTEVLQSDWLTTGPMVGKFEEALCAFTGAKFGTAVSNGTAALHAAIFAAGIGPGDEVIVPALTFAASANAVLYQGATPVFVDILPDSLLIDPEQVKAKIGPRTKAIMAVDYAGHCCDYDQLQKLAKSNGLLLIADACHAIGGSFSGRNVGTLADLSCFSFHPAKHITTSEGGMVLTDNEAFNKRLKIFRNHGISTDHRERHEKGTFHYDMMELGYNYRLPDVLCALGMSQLKKLPEWVKRRNEIASIYNKAFTGDERIRILPVAKNVYHAFHLFVIELNLKRLRLSRDQIGTKLRERGIGIAVHYPPLHLHPYYQMRFGYKPGDFPIVEKVHAGIMSIPMYSSMTDAQVERVINELKACLE